MQTLGVPNIDFIIEAKEEESLEILEKTDHKTLKPGKSIEEIFKGKLNPLGIDLLSKMLKFNPSERITVE